MTMKPNGDTTLEETIEAIYINLVDIISLDLQETETELKKELVLNNGCTVTYTLNKTDSSYNLNVQKGSSEYSNVREGFVELKISSQKD